MLTIGVTCIKMPVLTRVSTMPRDTIYVVLFSLNGKFFLKILFGYDVFFFFAKNPQTAMNLIGYLRIENGFGLPRFLPFSILAALGTSSFFPSFTPIPKYI